MLEFKRVLFLTLIICLFINSYSHASSGASAGTLVIKTDAEENLQSGISTVRISPGGMIFYCGGSMQFVASAYDSNGKRISSSFHWVVKSDISDFGTLDKSDGDKVIFSATNAGKGTIEVVNGSIKAEIPIEIRKPGCSVR